MEIDVFDTLIQVLLKLTLADENVLDEGFLKLSKMFNNRLAENNNMVCSPVKGVVKLGMISKDFKTHVIMPQSTSIKPLVYISSKMLEIGVGRRVNKGQILLPQFS